MHLGIGQKSYKHHGVSAALMLIVMALFEVAALLPLSANLFAVLGEPLPWSNMQSRHLRCLT